MSLVERLGLATPVVGAGLGGGLSTAALTVALGRAGSLGQIGFAAPARLRAEMQVHRDAGAGPLAVNLLLPFARRAHWEVAQEADVVVTFWGVPHRRTGRMWIHQCGSLDEAQAAVAAGADGVIAQGVEAGGHVRGSTPTLVLAEQVLAAVPTGYPVWVAGGVANRSDVETVLATGADGVVVGTRFLLSHESAAHPGYKQRLVDATSTVLTELFGAGWPAPHRVVPNAATAHHLRGDPRGPSWMRTLNRSTEPVVSRLPTPLVDRAVRLQRPRSPFLTPMAPTTADPHSLVDAGALYAGESVTRIDDIRPAAEIVAELTGR